MESAGFTLLDRFPATPAGHVTFLEFVRDEVHHSAEAKRQQSAKGYSDDTIASMVRGIKWAEAKQRLNALSNVLAAAVEPIAAALHRELTVGTVEQIDDLLRPQVEKLRDEWEDRRAPVAAAPNVAPFTGFGSLQPMNALARALIGGEPPSIQKGNSMSATVPSLIDIFKRLGMRVVNLNARKERAETKIAIAERQGQPSGDWQKQRDQLLDEYLRYEELLNECAYWTQNRIGTPDALLLDVAKCEPMGRPDHLAVFPKLKSLDDDGSTAELWDTLVAADREALASVGLWRDAPDNDDVLIAHTKLGIGPDDFPLSDEMLDKLRRYKPENCISAGATISIDRAHELMLRLRVESMPKECAIDEFGLEAVGGLIKIGMVLTEGAYPEEHLKLSVKGYRLLQNVEPAENEKDVEGEQVPPKMTWQQARERLENLRRQGEDFTSRGELAGRIGCSSSTVHKAIQNTPSLQVWATRERTSAPSAVSLNGAHFDNLADHRERSPAETAAERETLGKESEEDVGEAKLRQLIEEGTPEDRAKLHSMPPEKRAELARVLAADPDAGDKLRRRKA